MSTTQRSAAHTFPAPAKLNLFLHVTGRRPDGYHLLQSAFQLIDWCDTVHLTVRDDGLIRRTCEVPGVPEAQDLSIRAAALLQHASGCRLGADIAIDKVLPQGGGLGGGSSDAATTLLALNHLWELHWPRARLASLGLQLGADVPFFVGGLTAFVSGIGEELTPVALPDRWFAVIHPGQSVPTALIFSDPQLTRDHPLVRIADFLDCQHPWSFGSNDLQAVATGKFAEVGQALAWLGQHDRNARMTGSGACVFASFNTEHEARNAIRDIPCHWKGKVARSLSHHPLLDLSA